MARPDADRGAGRAPADLSSLAVAGLTRRRTAMLIGAMVAVWVVIVFARQVGAASAATARAEQMATDNAALTTQVDAMARELSLIQQPGFVQQAARAYGLGGRKEIAFALAPDAPPLADDAPGLGEPSGRVGGCAGQPARPLADAPVRPRRLTLGAPAGHAARPISTRRPRGRWRTMDP